MNIKEIADIIEKSSKEYTDNPDHCENYGEDQKEN
jgi:hypothetical protein